jgi:hypothetical protein
MLLVDRLFIFSELGNKPHESMSFSLLRILSRALQHWLSEMYSASFELSAISVCSLLDQSMGTPTKAMIKPVHNKHESRRCANSLCHTPAKSPPQYASSERFLFGFYDEWFIYCAFQVVYDMFDCFLMQCFWFF